MNFCVKEKICGLRKELEKPTVRNNISWNVGVYKDEQSKEPEVELKINKNTEMKLYVLALVLAGIVFLAFVCHRLSKISKLLKQ